MTSIELSKNIVESLEEKKAFDIKVLKVKNLTVITDYFIIATGSNVTQVKALADEVEYNISEKFGIKPQSVEGYNSSSWILLDYGEVIVHIFYKDTRDFYSLERLWSDAEVIDLNKIKD